MPRAADPRLIYLPNRINEYWTVTSILSHAKRPHRAVVPLFRRLGGSVHELIQLLRCGRGQSFDTEFDSHPLPR
jgi:hypothetical protein